MLLETLTENFIPTQFRSQNYIIMDYDRSRPVIPIYNVECRIEVDITDNLNEPRFEPIDSLTRSRLINYIDSHILNLIKEHNVSERIDKIDLSELLYEAYENNIILHCVRESNQRYNVMQFDVRQMINRSYNYQNCIDMIQEMGFDYYFIFNNLEIYTVQPITRRAYQFDPFKKIFNYSYRFAIPPSFFRGVKYAGNELPPTSNISRTFRPVPVVFPVEIMCDFCRYLSARFPEASSRIEVSEEFSILL